MKKRYWLLGLLILLGLAILPVAFQTQTKTGFALFSWNEDIMHEKQREAMITCFEQAHVTKLYQQFSSQAWKDPQTKQFLQDLKQMDIEVYALDGNASWAYEEQYDQIKQVIDEVITYNEREGEQLKGVVLDIEPYLLEEWDNGKQERKVLMETYADNVIHAYTYAKEHDLQLFVCIPTFFDVTNEDILEKIVAYGCDGIAIMNYNRSDEAGQIETEVALAKRYDKQVINIYELQQSGKHDLEAINTYADMGMDALWQSADHLTTVFDYDDLSFAYHHYEALLDLLAKEGTYE